jgi:hypothetical protein
MPKRYVTSTEVISYRQLVKSPGSIHKCSDINRWLCMAGNYMCFVQTDIPCKPFLVWICDETSTYLWPCCDVHTVFFLLVVFFLIIKHRSVNKYVPNMVTIFTYLRIFFFLLLGFLWRRWRQLIFHCWPKGNTSLKKLHVIDVRPLRSVCVCCTSTWLFGPYFPQLPGVLTPMATHAHSMITLTTMKVHEYWLP